MLSTWVTESGHDDKPLDWLFDLRSGRDLEHVALALRAVLEDPGLSIGDCQTALLAAECVAFLRGAPADLHRDARRWLEGSRFQADEALVALALKSVDAIAAASNLKSYWQQLWPEEQGEWMASVTALRERITHPESAVE